VLPRVSAALAQFIAPIAASAKQGVGSQKGFERFTPPHQGKKQGNAGTNQEQGQPSHQAKVIPFPTTEKAMVASPQPAASASVPAGISQALLQLMNLFQEQGSAIRRWLGTNAYQLAARQQKKTGRIRKGAVLDQKAE
jgi:hypothetical protein